MTVTFIKKHLPSLVFLAIVFVFGLLFLLLPKKDYSESEKRLLADTPTLTAEALFSGELSSELDTYLSDHFPFRDLFVGVNAYYELLTGRGGAADVYLGQDGYLIAAPTSGTADTVKTNVSRFADFAKQNGCDATLMIVPQTGYILDNKLPAVHRPYNDDTLFDTAKESLGDMAFIDLRERFAEEHANGTPLYYKTDHHLTSAGSFVMYDEFCQQKGFTADADYRVEVSDGFYGTSYSKSGYRLADPDTVELWKNDDLDVTVEIIEAGQDPLLSDSVFFEERLKEADQYPVFLDGNHALVTITNENAAGGKLLVVKDSYAHCFSCFAAESYSEIVMIDMRYYRQSVSQLIKDNGITDILYLYGIQNLSESSSDTAWLE